MGGFGGRLVGSLGESEDGPALPRDYGNLESWASEDVPALPREDSRGYSRPRSVAREDLPHGLVC